MQRNQLDRQQWAGDKIFSPIALRKVFSKKVFLNCSEKSILNCSEKSMSEREVRKVKSEYVKQQ